MKSESVERLNGWGSLFRFITPVLVTVNLFILSQMWIQLNQIGERMYVHQTNAEIHIPRSEFVELKNTLVETRREIIDTIRQQRRSP